MNFNFDRHIRLDRTLNEGGNAIKSSSPVSGDKALPIAEKVIGILKERYPDTEFAPIGSVGKKNAEQANDHRSNPSNRNCLILHVGKKGVLRFCGSPSN